MCVYIKHHPYSFMSLMSTPYASHRLRNGTAGILLPLRSHRQTVEGSTSANSAACASEYPAFTLAAFNVIFISSHHPIILFVCAFQVFSAFSVCQRVSQHMLCVQSNPKPVHQMFRFALVLSLGKTGFM